MKKKLCSFTLISLIILIFILFSIEIPDKQYRAYGGSKHWEFEIWTGGKLCFTDERAKIITSDIKYIGTDTPSNISYQLFFNDGIFTRIEGMNSRLSQLDNNLYKNIKFINGWNLYNTLTLKSKLHNTHILISWEENGLNLQEKVFLKVLY